MNWSNAYVAITFTLEDESKSALWSQLDLYHIRKSAQVRAGLPDGGKKEERIYSLLTQGCPLRTQTNPKAPLTLIPPL